MKKEALPTERLMELSTELVDLIASQDELESEASHSAKQYRKRIDVLSSKISNLGAEIRNGSWEEDPDFEENVVRMHNVLTGERRTRELEIPERQLELAMDDLSPTDASPTQDEVRNDPSPDEQAEAWLSSAELEPVRMLLVNLPLSEETPMAHLRAIGFDAALVNIAENMGLITVARNSKRSPKSVALTGLGEQRLQMIANRDASSSDASTTETTA